MIEIQTNGRTLDLPENFSIDIEDSNPIFNDRGSQSVPASIPASKLNVRILDFPNRIDAGTDPNSPERNVILSDGSYIRTGTMNITNAGNKEGITFNIGFDNSTAYAKWQGKKLNELSTLPVYTPQDQQDGYPVDWLLNELYTLYKYSRPKIDDLAVFPVAVNVESNTANDVEKKYWEVLNIVGEHGLSQPTAVKRIVDGELTDISVPEGYCVSPFVRVWRVLEFVFRDLNLNITANPFRDDTELARLVVLNNAADSVCKGVLSYADLMPDCTVEEFLNALWTRFGLTYNIDFNHRTVKLVLIRDIIKDSSQAVLDSNTAGLPLINHLTPQYIKLSAKTSIEGAAPGVERFEDFVKGLDITDIHLGANVSEWQMIGSQDDPKWDGDIREDWFDHDQDHDEDHDPDDGHDDQGMRMVAHEGGNNNNVESSMLAKEFITGMWYRLDSSNGKVQQSSSSFFNWDPNTPGLEPLELSSVDECVPVCRVSNIDTGAGNAFNDYCPTYLFGARHYHSFIKGSDSGDAGATTPLSFMFAYTKNNKTFGRINPEGEDGQKITLDDGTTPAISLLFQFSDGLFAKFWSGYDELLRHGSRSVEIDMVFDKTQINRLDLLKPVMLHSVRCLIDKMNYSLPSGKSIPLSLTLRTIQTQGDYDIVNEQNIPTFAAALRHLQWLLESETFGESLNTEQAKAEAATRFVTTNGYEPHGVEGDYYCVDARSSVITGYSRLNPTWQTDDTLIMPTRYGQKLIRKYKARIYYNIYEIHDISIQYDEDLWEHISPKLGTSYADVEYSVELMASWAND